MRIKWKELPPMNKPRAGHIAVVLDGMLFCIGGPVRNGASITSEYFDYKSCKWKNGPDLSTGILNSRACYDVSLGYCIITGGQRDGKHSSSVSCFEPHKGLTEVIGELDDNRSNHITVLL